MSPARGTGFAMALSMRELGPKMEALQSVASEQLVLVGVYQVGVPVMHCPAMEQL